MTSLFIPRSVNTSSVQFEKIFESFMLLELHKPSKSIWLVTNWINDIAVLDNRVGRLKTNRQHLENQYIHLSDLFFQLLGSSTCNLIIRDTPHNEEFLHTMNKKLEHSKERKQRLRIKRCETIKEGMFLGERFCITGSMEWTFDGTKEFIGEAIISTAKNEIANAYSHLQTMYPCSAE